MDLTKFMLTPRTQFKNHPVVIVGAGGIGARVVPMVVKMLRGRAAAQRDNMPHITPIHIIDPDIVEERNLLRQPFIAGDVGKPKAEVLARRYATEDVPITAWVGKVEEVVGQLQMGGVNYIGCLDAVAPRAFIKDRVVGVGHYAHEYALYIDAGNDFNRGQITLMGKMSATSVEGSVSRYVRITGHEMFPDVFEPEAQPETPPVVEISAEPPIRVGCSLALDTQTPVTNNMAAALVINYLATFWDRQMLANVGCRFSPYTGTEMIPGRWQMEPSSGNMFYRPGVVLEREEKEKADARAEEQREYEERAARYHTLYAPESTSDAGVDQSHV